MSPLRSFAGAATRGFGILGLGLLGACSTFGSHSKVPASSEPAHGEVADLGRIRTELGQLEADPQLAPRAPQAIKDAEAAVAEAQGTQRDQERYAHLVYIADRKVQTARALAESKVAEDQLKDMQGH